MRLSLAVTALVGLSMTLASPVRAQATPRAAGHEVSQNLGYMAQQMAAHTAYLREGECTAPHWIASVGILALDRDLIGNPDFDALFTTSGVAGTPILRFQDLNFENESALKASLGHRTDAWTTFELGYFGQISYSDKVTVTDPAGRQFGIGGLFGLVQQPQFPSPPAPPTFGFGNNTTLQSIEYTSKLQSAELNLVRDQWVFDIGRTKSTPWRELVVSWMGGVRYLKLDEFFAYRTRGNLIPGVVNDPGATLDYEIKSFNRMFGPQVGFRSSGRVWHKLSLGGEGRFAILANAGEQRTQVPATFTTPAFFGTATGEQSDIRRSFVYQLGVWAEYHIMEPLSVKVGFDFLRIAGRVLAPRQLDPGVILRLGNLLPLNDDEGATNFDGYSVSTQYKF